MLLLVALLASLAPVSCATAGKPVPIQPENRGEIQTRAADGMIMVYVPGGAFRMGSSEPEIEAAIALCRQHYNICNRWYYLRESPPHTVSLDSFWLDQIEGTNAQYHLCAAAGACAEPLTCKKGQPT